MRGPEVHIHGTSRPHPQERNGHRAQHSQHVDLHRVLPPAPPQELRQVRSSPPGVRVRADPRLSDLPLCHKLEGDPPGEGHLPACYENEL